MAEVDRIQSFLQRLSQLARGNLLSELERLAACGSEIPGSATIVEKLRVEFRTGEQNRVTHPSRYFFSPLEPLLVDGAAEYAYTGRILRGSLSPIWEWISRDLLPTMARDYINEMTALIAADKQREARRATATFQTKVVKCLESTLGSASGVNQTRTRLAIYTASPAAYDDLTKMMCVLRASGALASFNDALPARIDKFDDARVSKITVLLDAFGAAHAEALAFALALVATRLRTPWQLIRLATKAAPSKKAADVAATPYAIAVSMVLDRLDEKRSALRIALKNNRILVAKDILTDVYDTEYALQVRIDLLDGSDWGKRLRDLMGAISALVEAEVSRFPDDVGHVLGSRSLRSHRSFSGRLTHLAWKGRDAVSEGAAYCKRLISA
jgi:hypothetical protein